MAQCNSCSAPLPTDSSRCSYCGTRNDMDFAAVNRFTFDRQQSGRQCPDCEIPLETVRVDTGGSIFAIERCQRCYGLFFDVGEVQAFLDASVSTSFEINYSEIGNINQQRAQANRTVRYKKCPQCGVLMNRVAFAVMSGVVVDSCKEHGLWLDNGELIHLMEWKRAGGQLLADKKEKLERRERERQELKVEIPSMGGATVPVENPAVDMVSTVCRILFDFLR